MYVVETIHNVNGEDVRIITILDRDPASLVNDPPRVSEAVEQRSNDFRLEVLTSEDMLSAAQVASLLNVTRQHVHGLYKSGKILGLIHPSRERGVRFPSWQFAEGIAGNPLRQVLEVLKGLDAWDKWLFFTSKDEFLGGFSPVELLSGKSKVIPHAKHAIAMLQESHAVRLQLVLDAAKGYVDD